jgi:nucleotide-binding universal stress UspA family protein
MKTLLAVDGSDQSYEAARALGHLARADQVIVVHALDVPQPAYPMMMPEVARDIYTTIERGMREDSERLLARVKSILPPNVGPVATRMEVGTPADAILTVAEQERADLIVLGARGLGPIGEMVFGSVSHRVLSHGHCPTLVVNGPMRALRQALLTIQGPDDAAAATRFLAKKPFRESIELTVLTVIPFAQSLWPAGVSPSEAHQKQIIESAQRFVDNAVESIAKQGYRVSGATTLGAPSAAILGWAKETKPDLLLMGSRGRKAATRFLLGSVSHAVLHKTAWPVLIIR